MIVAVAITRPLGAGAIGAASATGLKVDPLACASSMIAQQVPVGG